MQYHFVILLIGVIYCDGIPVHNIKFWPNDINKPVRRSNNIRPLRTFSNPSKPIIILTQPKQFKPLKKFNPLKPLKLSRPLNFAKPTKPISMPFKPFKSSTGVNSLFGKNAFERSRIQPSRNGGIWYKSGASKPNSQIWRQDTAPGAYTWGYKWIDEHGTQMFREEEADGRGTVWGRYSFREASGRLRIVEYISDQNGFRTRVRSNEEGFVTSNPANAQFLRFEDENNIPD